MDRITYRALYLRSVRFYGLAAACTASLICVTAQTSWAQRRSRGDGAAGYGGTRSGSTGGESKTGKKGEEKQYPARKIDPAAGPVAEYRKPTYEHHRFVLSPDSTKIALSGSHVEKENAGTPSEKAKRDAAGKMMVKEHVLEVIDVGTGRSLIAFKPSSLFDNLALSPDNRFLAVEAADRPGVVSVLHLPTRKSKEFKTELRRILPGGIVFASDGRSIHVVAPDRLLSFSLANGEKKELKYEITSPAASYSAAMNLLAVGISRSKQGKPEVQIYDVAQGKQTKQLAAPSGPTFLQFSSDGKWLAATVAGGAAVMWQTSDWTTVGRVAGKVGFEPGQMAVSSDGQFVAVRPRAVARDETKVIDIKSGDTAAAVRTREVFFLPSGTLAIANGNGPYFMEVSSGNISELPAGAGDAALVQSGASGLPFGNPTAPVSDATAPAAQTGYGALINQALNPQSGASPPAGQSPTYPPSSSGAPAGQSPTYPPSATPPAQSGRR